jgi:hypothetical protein
VEDEVGEGDGDEQDERGLDHRREDTGLTNRNDRGNATEYVARREDPAEGILAAPSVEGDADGGHGGCQYRGRPPGDSGDARQRRSLVGGHRRPSTQS